VPINLDSNSEELDIDEVEVDSRHASKTAILRTKSYKLLAGDKALKYQRKFTSAIWKY